MKALAIPLAVAVALAGHAAFAQGAPLPPPTPVSKPEPTPPPDVEPTPPPPEPPLEAPQAPAAAAPPPAPPAPQLPPRDPSPSHTRVIGALEAGFAYETLFNVPIDAFDASARLGVDVGSVAITGFLEVTLGNTEDGLPTRGLWAGPLFEVKLDPVRIGFGVRIGYFGVQRITTNDTLATATLGVFVPISVDVLRLSEGGAWLYVTAKGALDDLGTTSLYSATGDVGVRF